MKIPHWAFTKFIQICTFPVGNTGSYGTGVFVSDGWISQGTEVLISRHTWRVMLSASASFCCHAYGSCSRSFQSPTNLWVFAKGAHLLPAQLFAGLHTYPQSAPCSSSHSCWGTQRAGVSLLWWECLCSSHHQILAAHQAAWGFEAGFSSLLRPSYWDIWCNGKWRKKQRIFLWQRLNWAWTLFFQGEIQAEQRDIFAVCGCGPILFFCGFSTAVWITSYSVCWFLGILF